MTDWFRSWHGAPTDPKWLGIGKRAGVAPGIAVAVAWALMDQASQATERGAIAGYDADGLACFFGCEPEQVEAIVQAMEAKGILIDGRFASWEKRQPKREDNASERGQAYRERKRTQANAVADTPNAPERERSLDTEKKEDTETEEKKEKQASCARSPAVDLRVGVTKAFETIASRPPPDTGRAEVWLAQGRNPEICLAVVREGLGKNPNVRTLSYFDSAIADAHAPPKPSTGMRPQHVPKQPSVQDVARALAEEYSGNA